MSGTSMAAPHVSGAMALLMQVRPGASVAQLKAALVAAASGTYFEASSPRLLLNTISARLRGSTPAPAPAPAPAPTPAPAPAPTAPAPSPRPAAPSPLLPAPMGTLSPLCATCPWCMFCK